MKIILASLLGVLMMTSVFPVVADEQPTKALFLGSSTIDKWNALNRLDTDFPQNSPLFAEFSPFETLASAIWGGTIAQIIEQSETRAWQHQPTVVVFYAGENDVAEGATPEKVKKDFQDFVATRPANSKAAIAFVSIKPAPEFFLENAAAKDKKRRALKANHLIHTWIKSNTSKNLYYISIWKPMIGSDGKPINRYFQDDNVHMTEAGYDLWAGIMRPYLHRILKKTVDASLPTP